MQIDESPNEKFSWICNVSSIYKNDKNDFNLENLENVNVSFIPDVGVNQIYDDPNEGDYLFKSMPNDNKIEIKKEFDSDKSVYFISNENKELLNNSNLFLNDTDDNILYNFLLNYNDNDQKDDEDLIQIFKRSEKKISDSLKQDDIVNSPKEEKEDKEEKKHKTFFKNIKIK